MTERQRERKKEENGKKKERKRQKEGKERQKEARRASYREKLMRGEYVTYS